MIQARTLERKMVTISEAEKIIKEGKGKADMLNKLNGLTKRQPAPPPPEGGISIRKAARKYDMRHTTLVLWVKEGYIPVVLETKNKKFIDEATTIDIIQKFKNYTGDGRRTLKKVMSGGTLCPEN